MTSETTTELTALRALALKGRAGADLLQAVTGLDEPTVRDVLAGAVAAEQAKEKNGAYRITSAGRERVAALLAAAREEVDGAALEALYERFHAPNDEIKALMTDWQMRDGEPNDHSDRVHDDEVASRIVAHHVSVRDLVDEIGASAAPLATYPRRLAEAARRVEQGDHDYVAKPLVESYHTVWFELHEDLIALLGRTRIEEAEAGRAL